MVRPIGTLSPPSTRRRLRLLTVAIIGGALVAASCSDNSKSSSTTTTTSDPVAAAEARVTTAQGDLAKAQDEVKAAGRTFCTEAKGYVTTLDRYGRLFTDSKVTVGDIKTGGADLAAPRASVSSAATAFTTAQTHVADAEKELADAQAALADAKATASSVPTSSTTPPSTTTTTLVPPASIARVTQAEADFQRTAQGITDSTPLVQAAVAYNSAAFALQVAWLNLLVDAGCVSDAQQAQAAAQVSAYTVALQTELQKAGYYTGPIDGVYGPQTVDAVKQLQTDAGLPVTGLVDKATAIALDRKVAALGQQAAATAASQTAAVQTVLKLAGYWSGPIDGVWTDELTGALKSFQTALGVTPTGAVDAATLAAFEQALEELRNPTTTTIAPTTTAPATIAPATTTTAPAPTTTATTAHPSTTTKTTVETTTTT
jgi:peptidoglycan hydrolase-like protein with peptidoglycan-binding domain